VIGDDRDFTPTAQRDRKLQSSLQDRLSILYVVGDSSCSISYFVGREIQLRKCLVFCLE